MKSLLTLALLAGSALTAAHAAPSFTTIDNAGDPTFNQLLGINDNGVIAGYFGSGMAVGHPNKGYVTKAPYTSFAPLNAPGSVQTQATGINDHGDITGFWSNTNLGSGDGNFGFLAVPMSSSRVFVDSMDPNTAGPPLVNQTLGVNKYGVAVGFYVDANNVSHGYTYNLMKASYQEVKINGAVQVSATGINDAGVICGLIVNKQNKTVGFTRNASGGVTTFFHVPGSSNTQLLGINNHGVVVGFYADANNIDHGIVYTPANGNWTQIDDPNGVGGTVINGLNNRNQAVGFYTDAAANVDGMLIDDLH